MTAYRKYPKITPAAARVNAGLSQSEAAKRINISKETLSNYENGRTVPDWDTVRKIEEVYEFSSDFIIFGEELRLKRNTAIA